ncbi:MAG: chromosome segregation protein SMC [Planctomycetaceae bacterium]|nr:chromosome segregation protein SMC [Planctomycetaceae bacterium]
MRLAKITLNAFKSFAHKTVISFNEPTVAIVGPNGCGKSNIVDAIKWVLGEQSAKSLRGSAMLDVIFNGSAGRKPAGMAAVTLHFENPVQETGGRFLPLDQDEVAVTRRLYRDGTSEYLVNGQRARLRDIRELFYDTGIGTNAYSIIEQGKVDAMLVNNPVNRRVIFEEAAGISKFKAQRKEAQRKLDRAEQNLLRCRDKVEDVAKRLRSVKVQAGRARTFQEHTQRLRELQLTHVLADYHRLQSDLKTVSESLASATGQREQAAEALTKAEQQRTDAEAVRQRLQNEQRRIEQQRIQTEAMREQAAQRQQFTETSLTQVNDQIERDQARGDHLIHQIARISTQDDQQTTALETLRGQLVEADAGIERATAHHLSRQHALNDLEARLEDEKAGTVNLLRQTTQLHNDIAAIDIESKNLTGHRDRLSDRAAQLADELNGLLDTRDAAEGRLNDATRLIATETARLEDQKEAADQLSQQQRTLTERLARAKENRSAQESRRDTLDELEQAQTGVDDAVKAVLARRASSRDTDGKNEFAFVRGLLAEMIEADVADAPLVEAALSGHQQALVVDRLDEIQEHEALLASLSGRVTFLPIDQLPVMRMDIDAIAVAQEIGIAAGEVRPMIDMVRHPEQISLLVWKLLGRTLGVKDLGVARRLRDRLPSGYRCITERGELLETDGRVVAGPITEASGTGLISRRSELSALQERITDLDEAIETDEAALANLSDRASHLERTQQELRQAIYEANTIKVDLNAKLDQAGESIARIEREQPVVSAEVEQIHRQLREADAQKQSNEQQAERLENESIESRNRAATIEQQIETTRGEVDAAREQVTAARVETGKLSEQITAGEKQLRQFETARVDAERQQRDIEQQLALHSEQITSLEASRNKAVEQIGEAQLQIDALNQQIGLFAAQLSEADRRVTAQSESARQQRDEVERHERVAHEQEIAQRELDVRSDGLIERAQEQLSLDLAAAYRTYEPEEVDWEPIETEIAELKQKIDRLGTVNLHAIDEQGDLEQQAETLSEQLSDIDRARAELDQLIRHLNEESRSRFEETFNQIREHFAGSSGMFRRLFGGGRADLMLIADEEGQVDVLESGIEIMAKPPGKEPQTINLLSGGERTMVAVALLMSIFKSRPSPFCILDEVDAALDEANVDRFNTVVKSFLNTSHFIIVTHHKRTMASCNAMYGITMQERGVSKVVDVRLDQVGADGRIAREAAEAAPRDAGDDEDVAAVVAHEESGTSAAGGNGDGGPGEGSDASTRDRLASIWDEQTGVELESQ